MVKKRVLKELELGKKSKEDLEYLQSLTADFFTGREHLELLDAWNHLQKTPGKTRTFTFSTKACPLQIAKYLESNYPFNRTLQNDGSYLLDSRPVPPFYAYIKHDKDRINSPDDLKKSDVGVHYHFYLEYENARSFASVATELGIPVTLLEGVRISKKAILQYLTHENDPSKHHYDAKEIHANFDVIAERESEQFDPKLLWQDYYSLRTGKMDYFMFYQKYERVIVRHSFSQILRTAETVFNASQEGANDYNFSDSEHNFDFAIRHPSLLKQSKLRGLR